MNTDLKEVITKDREQKAELTAKLKLTVTTNNSLNADLQIMRENYKSLGMSRL